MILFLTSLLPLHIKLDISTITFLIPEANFSSSSLLRCPISVVSAPRSLQPPFPTSFSFLFAIKDLFIPPRLDSIRFLQERRQQAGNEATLQKRPISIYIRGHPFHHVEITSRLCALLASNYPRMKTSPVLPFHSPSSPPPPPPPPPPQRRFHSLPRGRNRGEESWNRSAFRCLIFNRLFIIVTRRGHHSSRVTA